MDDELVAKLVNAHLVRGEYRGGALWYEIAHDRLIEPVRASNRRLRSPGRLRRAIEQIPAIV